MIDIDSRGNVILPFNPVVLLDVCQSIHFSR
jgi:hypothetical protein